MELFLTDKVFEVEASFNEIIILAKLIITYGLLGLVIKALIK